MKYGVKVTHYCCLLLSIKQGMDKGVSKMFSRNRNKIFIILLSLLLSTLFGCRGPSQADNSPAQSKTAVDTSVKTEAKGTSGVNISLYPGYMEIAKGSKVKLAPKLTPEGSNMSELQWVSGNPEVASVSADGIVTAVKEGDTVIDALLKGNSTKKAACAVHVKEDGSTLVYAGMPKKPSDTTKLSDEKKGDGKTKDGREEDGGKDKGSDGEVPTEYDKSPDIPVEVIPSLDEFVWTITIDDTYQETLNYGQGDIKGAYNVKLRAVKSGGKTADGQYKCTVTKENKIDTSDLDSKIERQSGGKVMRNNTLKTQVKDGTFNLVQYNGGDYNSYGTKKENVPTQSPLSPNKQPNMPDLPPLPPPNKQPDMPELAPLPPPSQNKQPNMPDLPPLPPLTTNKLIDMPELPPLSPPTPNKQPDMPELPPLIPLSKMALGSMLFSAEASFSGTITTDEGIGTGSNTLSKQNNAVPFKIGVYKDGTVEFYLLGSRTQGPFKGRITKKPIRQ